MPHGVLGDIWMHLELKGGEIDDPGATSQSDLPRSLPIQSDPLERHTKVARDLSPEDTKNRPWSDFPERHL
uniref:Uncharacterized protein n=1 Tax=Brassica oleracea var. oleracea TaxID=109376 RepID=A0A0D2ZWT9_BRAOL